MVPTTVANLVYLDRPSAILLSHRPTIWPCSSLMTNLRHGY